MVAELRLGVDDVGIQGLDVAGEAVRDERRGEPCAGLALDQLRAKAVAKGRIAADAQPTEAQLIAWIFEPGFTTASRVTQVSGRGIGMDVVRSEITALGGRVEVSTPAGNVTGASGRARPSRATALRVELPL